MTMNGVLQLMKVFSGIGRLVSHQRTWFSETKCIPTFLRFQKYMEEKILLPFTKIDTCTIMPEVFIFLFIYKSCNLLNHIKCVCVCVCVCMFMWFMRTQICIMTWV